ncbi:hypothetical protein I546_2018 [Mycobacterium kansasii 732]|nr:hypothetical protein I546_2018 [Mycobacterium kansasii 732]
MAVDAVPYPGKRSACGQLAHLDTRDARIFSLSRGEDAVMLRSNLP